jgi:hypothetical protein
MAVENRQLLSAQALLRAGVMAPPTVLAPRIISPTLLGVMGPLSRKAPVPIPPTAPSRGLAVSTPLYSKILRSGLAGVLLNVTLTVLPAEALMFPA